MRGKVLVLSLVAATLSVTSSSTTLAYLTDDEATTAVFTSGSVKIKSITSSIGRNDIDAVTGEPVSYLDGDILANAVEYDDYLATSCTAMLGVSTCNKYVYVQNTGMSDAFVRVRVMVPQSLLTAEEEGGSPPITLNYTESDEFTITQSDGVACGEGDEICNEYIFTRTEKLLAGQMTTNPVIDSLTYNVIAEASTEEENVEVESPTLTVADAGIRVYTEAIQAQGFATHEEAFNEYDN